MAKMAKIAFYNLQFEIRVMIGMFVSHQQLFAVHLVVYIMYEHVYEVSSLKVGAPESLFFKRFP